ncbi:MAG: MFS transporter [Ornithinimicrobium sp.]
MLERLLPARLGRNFRWLFGASTSANLGDGVLLSAGPLLVASITRDPFAISMAVFAQRLPWLMFGLVAGGVVDRVDRRALVMIADAARAIVLLGLVALLLTDQVSLPLLYAAFFLLGTAETFVDNAASTLTVSVVPRADLGVANSRIFGSAMITNQMAGPPLGAALFTVASGLAFGIHAVLLLLGVVLISRMRLPKRAPVEGVTSLRTQIREGMSWLWRYPPVRTLALMITIFNVTYGAVVGLYVLYAQERLEVGNLGFGILMSTVALGAVLGSALYARLEARFSFAVLLRAGLILETVSHAALALTRSPLLAGTILFLFGVHAAIWGTTSTTVRQLAVPELMLGRVNSVYMLGSLGGIAIGTVIGGWLAQSFGLLSAFWFAFGGSLVALVFLWGPMAYVAHAAEEPPGSPS